MTTNRESRPPYRELARTTLAPDHVCEPPGRMRRLQGGDGWTCPACELRWTWVSIPLLGGYWWVSDRLVKFIERRREAKALVTLGIEREGFTRDDVALHERMLDDADLAFVRRRTGVLNTISSRMAAICTVLAVLLAPTIGAVNQWVWRHLSMQHEFVSSVLVGGAIGFNLVATSAIVVLLGVVREWRRR